MAWSVSPELQAAIDSTDRQVRWSVGIWARGDGDAASTISYMVDSVTIDRSPDTAADNISLFSGSISAQATIELGHIGDTNPSGDDGLYRAYKLGPYGIGAWSDLLDNLYGMRAKVHIEQEYLTSAGWENVDSFYGRVEGIEVHTDGTATMTCRDYASGLQADASLPVAAVVNDSPALPLYACVEHLLRVGGFYRTPPPLADCVLSVPSLLPEIGDVAAPLRTEPNPAPNFGRYNAPSYTNSYVATETYAPSEDKITVIEGWFRSSFTAADRTLIKIATGAGAITGAGDGLELWADSLGTIGVGTLDQSTTIHTPDDDPVWPYDQAWHYLYAHIVYHSGESYLYVAVDGNTTASGWQPGSLIRPDNGSAVIEIGGMVHEGVSIRYAPLAEFVTELRNTWTPNYAIDLRGDSPGITAIPRGVTGSAWQTISAIATATGAVFRWREDGAWRWQERESFHDRRFDNLPVKNLFSDHWLISSGYSYDVSTMRSQVSIDYTDYTLLRSTASNPAWKADDVIIVNASSEQTFEFETDTPIFGIAQPARSSAVSDDRSTVQFVRAYQVGDPAAQPVGGVQVRITPTPTGIRVEITNPLPARIALWDPVSGQPMLQIQGWYVTGGNPTLYTVKASDVPMTEEYTVPSSTWRQDRAYALAFADAVAAQVALPAMIFSDQVVVADPAITVDDVIRVNTPDMSSNVRCQIIGMNYGNDFENSLTVRPIHAPTGWVLDIPGRSALPNVLAV